ncbi:MAG TPA: hypothetical protein DDY16_00500 [Tenacibaculum sp.]|nr:hypothetical protein [Tenacibaculum sp.]
MKKVVIVIGHRTKKQGAYSPYLGESEYSYMEKVAYYLQDIVDVYQRPNTLFVSETTRINQMVNTINKQKYDLVLSLHFNSFHDRKAHGATALHYITNSRTKQIANQFIKLVSESFSVKKRSLIPVTSTKERGGVFVIKTKADAVLLEPFFGSNLEDAIKFKNKHEEYANTIKALITKYCQ